MFYLVAISHEVLNTYVIEIIKYNIYTRKYLNYDRY